MISLFCFVGDGRGVEFVDLELRSVVSGFEASSTIQRFRRFRINKLVSFLGIAPTL